jgi:hypothetical protein
MARYPPPLLMPSKADTTPDRYLVKCYWTFLLNFTLFCRLHDGGVLGYGGWVTMWCVEGRICGLRRHEACGLNVLAKRAYFVWWTKSLHARRLARDPWSQWEVANPSTVHHLQLCHEVLQCGCTSGENVAIRFVNHEDHKFCFLLLHVLVNSLIHSMLQLDNHHVV